MINRSSETPQVAVVGAGVTGLTAAAELSRCGISCIILERSSEIGGMCRSRTIDGVIFDTGPHMLMMNPHRTSGSYTRQLLSRERLFRRRYLFAISNGNRFWQSPMSPMEYLRIPAGAKGDILKAMVRRLAGPSGEKSLENYIRRRSGEGIYSEVFAQLIVKKLGLPGNELHEDWWTRPPKPVQSSGKQARLESDTANPLSAAGKILHDILPHYLYPEEGIRRVPELLRDRFKGEIVTSCGDVSAGFTQGRITELAAAGRVFPVSATVWTASPGNFYKAIGESCPAPAPTSSTRIVYTTFKTDRYRKRPFLYTYHHGENTLFNRVYYPSSIFRKRTPSGIEGLCFETRLTEEVSSIPAPRLIARTVKDALRTGLIKGRLLSAETEDIPHASPLFQPDYTGNEVTLFRAAERFSNLIFAGRLGNYCNCLIPGAVEQGLLAAWKIKEMHSYDNSGTAASFRVNR